MTVKINKHRRLTKIVQVLERWAPLDSAEVTQHLCQIFDADEGDLKRNVGNDLKFLREEGEIIPLYFNKLGKLISVDLEPEGEAFYRIKWQLKESATQMISGANLLSQFQCFIECSDHLENDVRLKQGIGKSPQDFIYFYFDLNHELYHFQLPRAPHSELQDKGESYLAISIARTTSQKENRQKDFQALQNLYPDLPCLLLYFNDPFLSSFESQPPITLLFKKGGDLELINEANKNEVESLEIPQSKASDLLSYLQVFRNQTQTQHWTELKAEESFRVGSQRSIASPFIFRIKETTGFVVV
ncbi:MAG: hypothetical protein NXH75_17155 [Halobacteriovoraceae bacterium]|nr:hypothetical protein [Halobacteriovoraceae bacterium]